MKFRLQICLVLMGLLVVASTSFSEPIDEVRMDRLSAGINIPRWLWYGPDEVSPFLERVSHEDLDLIVALEFRHVRIPIQWSRIYDADEESLLNQKSIALLDEAIKICIDKGLGVVVDLHHIKVGDEQSNYSGPLESDPEFVDLFVKFWGSFAKHLSQHDPAYVYLEPMNEPTFRRDLDAWPPIQNRLIAEIRRNAPDHTIHANGAQWASLGTMLKLEPLDDPNIVYKFHYYEPFAFTHQGATWSSSFVKSLRGVPYPSTPENVMGAVERTDDEQAKKNVKHYGQERWDAAKIEENIAKAGEWGTKHNVSIVCNEFGVYRRYSNEADQIQWHHDVTEAFRKHGIGWTNWELDGGFGFFTREDGRLAADPDLARAMGLNAEAAR